MTLTFKNNKTHTRSSGTTFLSHDRDSLCVRELLSPLGMSKRLLSFTHPVAKHQTVTSLILCTCVCVWVAGWACLRGGEGRWGRVCCSEPLVTMTPTAQQRSSLSLSEAPRERPGPRLDNHTKRLLFFRFFSLSFSFRSLAFSPCRSVNTLAQSVTAQRKRDSLRLRCRLIRLGPKHTQTGVITETPTPAWCQSLWIC